MCPSKNERKQYSSGPPPVGNYAVAEKKTEDDYFTKFTCPTGYEVITDNATCKNANNEIFSTVKNPESRSINDSIRGCFIDKDNNLFNNTHSDGSKHLITNEVAMRNHLVNEYPAL